MTLTKRGSFLLLLGTLAVLLASCSGGGGGKGGKGGGGSAESAEEYPSDTITMLVPYTAGGPTDLAARSVATCFEGEFGQTLVVDNRPGAGGALAMNELINSEADGYTIKIIAAPATVITPYVEENVTYTEDDFVAIGVITEIPSVLGVSSASEYETAEEFFDAAQANPGALNVGVPGATTSQSIELQRLAEEYGVQVTTVPFDGNAELTAALLGNNVDAIFVNASEDILDYFESGEFRPLAVSPAERVEYLPDVPTLRELGYETLTYSTSIFGLGAPNGTSPEIVSKLEDTLSTCLEDPQVREQLGENYVPDEFVGSEELRRRLDEIVSVYKPVLTS